MRIRDKRSYLVFAQASSGTPVTLYLWNTAGEMVRSINVTTTTGVFVTVPIGLTVEFVSDDLQKPTSATVNGAEATTAGLTGFGNGGYILTTHPRVGDIVVFNK